MAVPWTARRCRGTGGWRRRAPEAEQGFLLPLAFGVSLVLMLSALSVQTAALHGSTLVEAELRQRQRDDALASAAEQVAGQLSGDSACLLPLPYDAAQPSAAGSWGTAPAGCPVIDTTAELRDGGRIPQAYSVVSWTPGQPPLVAGSGGVPGLLRLRLEEARPGAAGPERLFALSLERAEPTGVVRVVDVRGMGR
jgi:hypothetical protein